MKLRIPAARSDQRIRILHLITGLGLGGAERVLQKLVSRLDRERFETTVVSLTRIGPVGEELRDAGMPVLALDMHRGGFSPAALWKLRRIVRMSKPDILQSWLYHADAAGLLMRLTAGSRKLIWNIRCSDMTSTEFRRTDRYLLHLLAKLSAVPDAVIVNSEAGRKAHAAFGYHPKRWESIPNGVDLDAFRPTDGMERLRNEIGLPPRGALIGFPARFHPMKDHETFIRAAQRLKDSSARFVLIGENVDSGNSALVHLIAEAQLQDRVHLMGARADIARVMAAVDIVTLTSAYGEGFPNVLIEALACAVPCVSTDVGDARAVLGDTGVVVPTRDPPALASAWQSLLELGPEGRRTLGLLGRDRAATRFSLDRMVDRYATLYTSLLGGAERC